MKGKILDYNFQESKGIISGEDGNRYTFENSQWKGSVNPKANQVVDFDFDGQNAKDIYLDKAPMNFDGVKDKLGDINAQEKVNEVKDKLNVIKKNGIQNKFGFIISIILAICLFISVASLSIGFGSFVEFSVIDSDLGFIALIGTIISAFLFYSGGKQIFTKISIIVVSVVILLFLKDIYIAASDMVSLFGGRNKSIIDGFAEMLHFSIILLITATVLYIISGFKKGYKEIGANNER
ncbi:hypothetical protein [Aliarcobacter cryaerophilus]|jgi:hypothetical protein|uniref:hypothetical protein n=1 Tax=Aliarcobacter cryaerophilus TaxID=28198 RepID=UPI0021B1C80A|nr:hypothetical protein [Aliarcobacter cryaerophilus]MCT7444189.1 hypothetical protein [Aliarcobacter cryaerophilus]MCT7479371.1 hypothetical protein [Aliarcobacter cryaerophilus]MCT7498197.1 hypothetical protein [Aliarcobacter cryaerophilus]MCT7542567.1 hypothetical protein [Aliarcobacter cryaerophilus]